MIRKQLFHLLVALVLIFTCQQVHGTVSVFFSRQVPSLCIAVPNDPVNRATMVLASCSSSNVYQKFSWNNGDYWKTIVSGCPCASLCWSQPGEPVNGTPLIVETCPTTAIRFGTLIFNLRSDYSIRTDSYNGLCVDIPYFNRLPQAGDRLQFWQCHGGPNQQFSVRQIA